MIPPLIDLIDGLPGDERHHFYTIFVIWPVSILLTIFDIMIKKYVYVVM